MKLASLLLTASLVLTSQIAFANEYSKAKELFKTHCASCHGVAGGMDMSKRVAPPIIGVKMHYIKTYSDKDSFIAAIADWVEKPDKDNSLMRGAINRFNIMPAISINRKGLEAIASYIYDGNIEKPSGFQKHFEKQHGKN